MPKQDKTKEQLLYDLRKYEFEIRELKSAENNQKKLLRHYNWSVSYTPIWQMHCLLGYTAYAFLKMYH